MLDDLLTGMEAYFDGGAVTQLRAQENRYRDVGLQKGNLITNSRSEVSGVSARVCRNGMYGFASCAEYSTEKLKEVLRTASANARLMDRRASRKDYRSILVPSGIVGLNRPIVDTEQNRLIEACRQVDEYIVSHCPKLISRNVGYSEDSMEKRLLVSEGKSGHTTVPRCWINFGLTVEALDGAPVSLYDSVCGAGSFADNFTDLSVVFAKVDRLYEKVMAKREGVHPEAGDRTVVLGGILAGMLSHEAVGHTVEADLVKGGSVAGPMLGQMVASEKVTLVDFANTVDGKPAPLPVYLDDEGVEAKDAVLIQDGRLVGYMNNRELAAYYGMEPTGSARAWGFADEPIIRMRNTSILPGKDTLEEIIASVDDGYYLTGTNNGEADLTGGFMFGVTCGYEIKKGKLGRAIRDTTVSGLAFDMLKTVDMVSNKINWEAGCYCGKGQPMSVSMGGPELRCKITIGGR